ncbi:hypothetical protein BC936DRAFT_144838 [Jimgerdemannia flammicorona]|uniref:Uncharacterized protein n=1 Tax=Jimgerdemannia flammicorona TaxID=994334 RepID=A0A433DBK6_9FUNG|nr:hypothetical protein BC936DRAFT_144838 [Jimgerdemannia flammicorona]
MKFPKKKKKVGEFEIMAGDAAGVVTSFHPQEQFWRLSVSEHSARLLTSTTVRDRRPPVPIPHTLTSPYSSTRLALDPVSSLDFAPGPPRHRDVVSACVRRRALRARCTGRGEARKREGAERDQFDPRDAPHRVGDGGGDDATDYLLCTGYFNGVHVFKDGEVRLIALTAHHDH